MHCTSVSANIVCTLIYLIIFKYLVIEPHRSTILYTQVLYKLVKLYNYKLKVKNYVTDRNGLEIIDKRYRLLTFLNFCQ